MGQGTVHDFQGQSRISPRHVQRLRTLHERLARDFSAALAELLRTGADVSVTSVDQIAYGRFLDDLRMPTCFYLLNADPLADRFMLDVEPSILYAMIDRLLGGAGHDEPLLDRPLTDVEVRLAARIVRLFLRQCRTAWRTVIRLQLDVLQVESNPRPLRVLPADEMVILIAFELVIGQRSGMMRLCLPCRAVERFGDALLSASLTENSTAAERPVDDSLAEVNVTLAETRINVDELADLHIGDVILTETPADSPATVAIEGIARFHAKPGAYQGRKAVHLTGPIDNPAPA